MRKVTSSARALPRFRGERGLGKLHAHHDGPGYPESLHADLRLVVIFSACSVAFTLAIGMVLACLVQ